MLGEPTRGDLATRFKKGVSGNPRGRPKKVRPTEDGALAVADRPLLSFREFVAVANPRYRWYPHCIRIADVLQRVADGELKRVMIFAPPRHGKSELVSRLFSAYLLYRYPWKWVGINSYGLDLARTLSRAAQENFLKMGGSLKTSAKAVSHWETNDGGGMWSAGVGGPITGKGFHYGIIDDPTKNHIEAASTTTRESHKEWWHSTFMTREEPNEEGDSDGAIIIIQTRWHDDDLSGWLLNQERGDDDDLVKEHWHIVFLEAIKEDHPPRLPDSCTVEPDPREPGEPLCPERRPLHKLRQIEARNAYFFAALYQQSPRPRNGTLFQRGSLIWVDAVPGNMVARIRYWDKAGAAPGKGDWTVGVLLGKDEDGYWWIENVVRGQWPADPRNKVIRETAERDQLEHGWVSIGVEQPPGLAKEATDTVIRMLAGFNAFGHPVHSDKVERAEPVAAQIEAGNVRILRDPSWNEPFLRVLEAFPFGANDDDVDALSGAFNCLAVAHGPATWGLAPIDPEWRG